MERLRRLVALLRAGDKAMFAGSLALFAASLFLPLAYGGAIWGVMPGWMLLFVSFLSPRSLGLVGLPYLASPLSLLAAKHSSWLAASLAGYGLLLPILILATEGLYIDNHHAFPTHLRLLNTGCLCLLVADLLMFAAIVLGVLARQLQMD